MQKEVSPLEIEEIASETETESNRTGSVRNHEKRGMVRWADKEDDQEESVQ